MPLPIVSKLKRIVNAVVRRREDGQDLLEYALLVSLIALVAMSAVTTVGSTIKTVFWDVIAAATAAI
jgi:Flp pilus assembly pilin Flp